MTERNMAKNGSEKPKNRANSDKTPRKESITRIIESYSRFVPQEVLQLMGRETITDIHLGDYTETTMTILFADIRGFTALSEKMTPQYNFFFINSYLAQMEPVIIRHKGIIDKYIGDSIMALFPTNADDALSGAIGLLSQLALYNSNRRKPNVPPVRIGIGLNTGLMMLGIIGGNHRMESTVISDAVNLASRIESMTKDYDAPLLISEHTYYSLENPSRYHIRFADRVRVKGKEQPQSIYEVFDEDPLEEVAAKERTIRTFERAIAYYHSGEVPSALDLFTACLKECPNDKPAKAYVERCHRFLQTGVHDGTGEVGRSIAWTPYLEIGDAIIDEQHRRLFDRVNEFTEAIRTARGFSHTKSVISFLETYALEHFKSEEESMKEHNYPFLQAQQQQHTRFSKYLARLKGEIEEEIGSDPHFLLFKVQVFVADWVMNHTAKSDRHFGKFLKMKDSEGA